jgi:hypothetical protein
VDDLLIQVGKHLEFFGYSIESKSDDWIYARHPFRWNFHYRGSAAGLRLFCWGICGKLLADERAAWLEHVNRINDSASLCRFALMQEEGIGAVRIRAFLPGTYDRRLFGIAIDMWHEDLGMFHRDAPPQRAARKPQFGDQSTALIH